MSGTVSAFGALTIAVAALAGFELWALVHVLRQNGRLLLRLEAVEAKLAGGAEAPPPGLPVNSDAPAFSLQNLVGDTVTLEMLLERGKPLLLLFSEPGCGACDAAIPEVAQWQREYGDRLLIVPISRGDVKENRAKSAKYGLRNVLLQTDSDVAQAYQAQGTPSAVLVKEGRIDSSLALGTDAIRGLVARATLPASVTVGDPVPSLRLPDLSGKLIDLAQLQTRRTLMLFWSPSCGFCQQMLEDLKRWEHNPQDDAPELVVISAGALDENRKQGFSSRVLLDPYYAASQVFNSGGTPSAVMVERGRVASSVAVGAEAVLGLAGAVPADERQPA
jgi:thiol-disulfide isomerase/thioredoxin